MAGLHSLAVRKRHTLLLRLGLDLQILPEMHIEDVHLWSLRENLESVEMVEHHLKLSDGVGPVIRKIFAGKEWIIYKSSYV